MEFNSLVFPAPPSFFEGWTPMENEDLIWIPKLETSSFLSFSKKEKSAYIPCLFIKSPKKSDKVLLFFHGNGDDIGYSSIFLKQIQEFVPVNMMAMEYPGYSLYPGKPSASKILEDADYVFNYMTNDMKISEENIIIFGRSIGSGPACNLAAKHKKIAGLLLMSAYTQLIDVVKHVAGKLSFFVANRFKNILEIPKVESPILFIHGRNDTLITYQHSIKLSEACKHKNFSLCLQDQMTHNDFSMRDDIIKNIKEFFKRYNIQVETENSIQVSKELHKIPDYIAKKSKL